MANSAVSSKRSIRRDDFSSHCVSDVSIETAGTIDLDIELRFRIDGSPDGEATLVKHDSALLYTVNTILLARHVKHDFGDVSEKSIQG